MENKLLILFVGDYIQLHNNFYGSDSDWLQVTGIEPYDICLLSNGARVCASREYIKAFDIILKWQGA